MLLHSAVSGMKRAQRRVSRMQGVLGEETYIVPVASCATALFEQGRNICLRPAGTVVFSGEGPRMANENCNTWQIRSSKYDGTSHRLWTRAYPLQDHPLYRGDATPYFTLLVPAHTVVEEGNGDRWSSPYDVVACFYAAKYYQVMVLYKETGTEYYCNSCTIAEIDENRQEVRFADMDLDLLVDQTGDARVVDQSEFEQNRLLLHYPEYVSLRVQTDLEELKKSVRLRQGVFSPKRYDWRHKQGLPSRDANG